LQKTLASTEGALAKEIAEGLGDEKSIRFYIGICFEYSPLYIREVYEFVRSMPAEKIKKSRGALFAYLIRKYEHFDTDN
jgi:hypothetical protein